MSCEINIDRLIGFTLADGRLEAVSISGTARGCERVIGGLGRGEDQLRFDAEVCYGADAVCGIWADTIAFHVEAPCCGCGKMVFAVEWQGVDGAGQLPRSTASAPSIAGCGGVRCLSVAREIARVADGDGPHAGLIEVTSFFSALRIPGQRASLLMPGAVGAVHAATPPPHKAATGLPRTGSRGLLPTPLYRLVLGHG